VFTDGEENEPPFIINVTSTVLQEQCVVYGLLLIAHSEDHDLIELSKVSGGTFCIYDESDTTSNDYYNCLNNIHQTFTDNSPIEVS